MQDHRTQAARQSRVDRSRTPPAVVRYAVLLLLLAAGPGVDSQEAAQSEDDPGFKMVIHADNPVLELEADYIAKLFRKKIKRWDHGPAIDDASGDRVKVVPVDLVSESPIRRAFTRGVHGKRVEAIDSYWQRMIFSGRDDPPPEKQTEDEVLAFVAADPGAIGYVSADKELGDGVKELKVVP